MEKNDDLLDQEAKPKKIKHEFSIGLSEIKLSGFFAWYFLFKLGTWVLIGIVSLLNNLFNIFNL